LWPVSSEVMINELSMWRWALVDTCWTNFPDGFEMASATSALLTWTSQHIAYW
jgi:hypothetical protein